MPEQALVVGGGVGGLSAAIALRQAGIETVAFERAAELSRVEVGAGMTLWPNAMIVLDRLGVGDEVRSRGWEIDLFEQRTWRGRLLVSWPLQGMAQRLGAGTFGVRRPDLHAALAGAAGPLVRANSECTDVEDEGSGVTALLANQERVPGEVLIGADGVTSGLRQRLLDDGAPRFAGLSMWRANVELDGSSMPKVAFNVYWGPGARFVWFRSGPSRLSWEAVFAAPLGAEDPPGESKRAALARYEGWPDVVGEIIEATDASAILRSDVVDRPPSTRWGTGRITLLGDAAHPMTFAVGQGAAQALEDAVVLAGCLRSEGVTASALRTYEQRRMARSAHFQTLAWRLARLGRWRSPVAGAVRAALLRGSARLVPRIQEKEMRFEL
jgi:2-polyprenyl-6-methoxyphenol hydroxylase-like FAD-dependent oxidoreductase